MNPKPDRRTEARTLVILVLLCSAFFGFIVLPQLNRVRSMKQKSAPDFTLPVIHGGAGKSQIKLSELRGKAVLLDFWASWCAPCRQQIPTLARVAQKFEKELTVIGVNTGDERAKAEGFLETLGVRYPSVEDAGGHVANSYGVTTLPTLVLIDRQGRIKFVGTHVMSERELQAELAEVR